MVFRALCVLRGGLPLFGALALSPLVTDAPAAAQVPADSATADAPAPGPTDSASPAPAPADSAALASAYLDERARELVGLARSRLEMVDRSIRGYSARVAEKATVRVHALRRDRLIWSREVVSAVDWERAGRIRIEVLGAREVVPLFIPRPQVPDDLGRSVNHLAFDPSEPFIAAGPFTEEGVFDPLLPGGESNYRFRSGGARTIRLPDGREIRLHELQFLPRRRVPDLVEGSLWLDDATHSIVQATFRPARPASLLDAGVLGSVEGTLDYVTVEFGLWDLQWWLPRIVSARGVATASGVGSGSLVYERVYSDYRVDGVARAALVPAERDTAGARAACPSRITISVGGRRGRGDGDADGDAAADAGDSTAASPVEAPGTALPDGCYRYDVVLPPDSVDLAASELLTDEPFDAGATLFTPAEIEAIRERVGSFGALASPVPELSVAGPFGEPGLIRYNRVEGLSIGARVGVRLGPLGADITGRIGHADREPGGRAEVGGDFGFADVRLAGFRDLVSMDPQQRPFTLGASISSLLFGNDEADYYRVAGCELSVRPPIGRSRWYELRLFARRESAAAKETDFSLPHLIDESNVFPANAAGDEATQYGGALRLRGGMGDDPLGLRLSAEAGVDAAIGTFEFLRPSLTLGAAFPLPGRFVGRIEGSAGRSFGDLPVQHLWRLGGSSTLRGYDSGAMVGEAYWRGRAELATEFPGARLVLFSDAGWAGGWAARTLEPGLVSAGAGVSFLDGLMRVDLARALKAPRGWRLTAYLDAWL